MAVKKNPRRYGHTFSDESRRKMSESAVRRAARQASERIAAGWVPKPMRPPLTPAQSKMMQAILSQPANLGTVEPKGRLMFHTGFYDDMPPAKPCESVVYEPVDYREYIKSEEWREKANAAKSRVGWSCQVCNSTNDLHAHHRTYLNLGHEKPEDITVLCSVCHALYHKNGKIE